MKRIAVFPGSFDPFTTGHEAIVLRSIALFDQVIIAIGSNSTKNYLFPAEQRKAWIEEIFSEHPSVEVEAYQGLTVDFCRKKKAGFLLRGLRNAADFQYEEAIAQMNKAMYPELETVFLLTDPAYSALSSTILREIFKNGGDISRFVPGKIAHKI